VNVYSFTVNVEDSGDYRRTSILPGTFSYFLGDFPCIFPQKIGFSFGFLGEKRGFPRRGPPRGFK
jgi:hypothetical protein